MDLIGLVGWVGSGRVGWSVGWLIGLTDLLIE